MKKSVTLWILLGLTCCFAQQSGDPSGVALKEVHLAPVNDVLVLEDRNEVYSADGSGKILIHDFQTGDFKSVFKEADNYPIDHLFSFADDRISYVKSFWTGPNTLVDSIYTVALATKEMFPTTGIQGSLSRKRNENHFLIKSSQVSNYEIALFQVAPIQQLRTLRTTKKVQDVSFFSPDTSFVYVQNIGIDYKNELVLQKSDGQILRTEALKEGRAQYKVLFENKKSFLLFNYDSEEKVMRIYRYLTADFSSKLIFEKSLFGINWQLEITEKGNEWVLFPTLNNYETDVIYGKRSGQNYQVQHFTMDKGLSHMYLRPDLSLQGFVHGFQPNGPSVSQVNYNPKSKSLKTSGRSLSYGMNRAYFLENGDYVILNYNDDYETNVKYYKAATFQSKYGKLKFTDWLELNKGIRRRDRIISEGQQDFSNNSIAFLGTEDGVERLFDYNLGSDTFTYLSPVLERSRFVIDYNSKKGIALAVEKPFTTAEYPSLRTLELCTSQACKPVDDDLYLKAVLNDNAELLATINQDFLLEIRSLDPSEVIYSKQLKTDQSYELHTFQNGNFALSVEPPMDFNKCVNYTLFIAIDADLNVQTKQQDCFLFNAIDYDDQLVAMAFDHLGVVIGDKTISLEQANPAVALALSKNNNLLFVSHANGVIGLYDSVTTEKKAEWILQSDQEQLVISTSGYYLANFDASTILTQPDDKTTRLARYLQPAEVLKTFGSVDQEYLSAIKSAENVRAQTGKPIKSEASVSDVQLNGNTQFITNVLENTLSFKTSLSTDQLQVKHNGVVLDPLDLIRKNDRLSFDFEMSDTLDYLEIVDSSTGDKLAKAEIRYQGPPIQSDLHVLAIGVSQYQQSANNLTFADKDALDISRFYGNLPDEEIQAYYDKFYARPLRIENAQGQQEMSSIKKFFFERYGFDLKYLGGQGRYWYYYNVFEKAFFLYDFQSASVSRMNMPAYDTIESISFSDQFKLKLKGDGFYFRTKAGWNVYEFASNTYRLIKVPFDEEMVALENIYELENDRWMHVARTYNGLKTELVLTIFDSGSTQTIKTELNVDQGIDLLSVAPDASYFLFKDYMGSLYFFKRQDETMQLVAQTSALKFETLDSFFIHTEEPFIVQSRDFYEGDKRTMLYQKIDFELKPITQQKVHIDLDQVLAAVVDQGELFILKSAPPLVDKTRVLMADKDEAFAKAGPPASFKHTYVTYLLNEDATQASVKRALKQLKQKVKPQDQVLVFFAGHGVLDEDLQYYYAPHDMDFDQVTDRGVSFDDIIAALSETQTSKMLLLMDTCHSGNTLDMEDYEIVKEKGKNGERGGIAKRVGNKQEPVKVSEVVATLFDNINTVNGVTVLSASSGQDVAFEAQELSNGAFTTAYLQQVEAALRGRTSMTADYNNKLVLSPTFIDRLRVKILELTNNKQEMDIREKNELTTIKLW